jgi:subtilase family serine protease
MIVSHDGARRRPFLKLVVASLTVSALGLGAAAAAGAHPSTPNRATISAADPGGSTTVGLAQLSSGRGSIRYAIPKRLCPKPTPTRLSCMAMRLVDVPKGTKGAKAYIVPSYTTGPAGGFTPADLATAYGYNPASSAGLSQTVAIVDAYDDPNALSELNAFDAHYGLPKETTASFRKVNEYGKASPLPKADAGWAGEIALDIQSVRAVCHHCKILLVEANAPSNADLATAVNSAAALHATEISNSYGGPEDPAHPASAAVANAYNHPGVVITASTGDHGWYDWDYANDAPNGWSDNAPNTPASYPTVVAVGGTALGLNADGTRHEEDVWNENGPDDQNGLAVGYWWGDQGASGGGCSTTYAAKPFQAGVAGYGDTGCGSKRLAGDIAALADPYTGFDVDVSGKWQTVGGTSLASPLIAAMWALAGGSGGVAYPAQSLYDHLRWASSSIYDVTLGGNAFCAGDSAANCSAALQAETDPPTGNPNNLANGNSFYANGWAGLLDCGYPYDGSDGTLAANTQCNAVSGYDGPSGVGAPHGLNLFTRMGPSIKMSAPSLIKVNRSAAFTATSFSDNIPNSSPAAYRWAWGDGHSTVTATAATSHTYTAKGSYTVKLTVVDNLGRTSPAVSKKYTIGYAPIVTISGATTVHHNTTHTWTAKASDRNTGGKIVKWVWRIGSTVVGGKPSLSHNFTRPGSYKLSVTVTDNSGLHATKTITVTVVR